jgi:hypothetical protein
MSLSSLLFELLFGAVLVAALLAIVVWYADPWGLFRDVKGRWLAVYADERGSKHLLAQKYVPQNFEGVFLGGAQSSALNPRLMAPFIVYNASLATGNAADLAPIAHTLIRSGEIRFIVLCLSDALVQRASGAGGGALAEDPLQAQVELLSPALLKAWFDVELRGQAPYADTVGYRDPELDSSGGQGAGRGDKVVVDEAAMTALSGIVADAHNNEVEVFAYYHPYPSRHLKRMGASYKRAKERLRGLFGKGDVVVDMNSRAHKDLWGDKAKHLDGARLSEPGARAVIRALRALLLDHIEPASVLARPAKGY